MASFVSFLKSAFIPSVKAQDEVVNPQETLKEECLQKSAIGGLFEKFQTCNDRVSSRKQTEESCAEELFDYMDALNNCVSEKLFSKLK